MRWVSETGLCFVHMWLAFTSDGWNLNPRLCWLPFMYINVCMLTHVHVQMHVTTQNHVILSRLYFAIHPPHGWSFPPLLTIGPLRGVATLAALEACNCGFACRDPGA